MKRLIFLIIGLQCIICAVAQKPVIDTSIFNKWPHVGGGMLSADGQYAGYSIYNDYTGYKALVLSSANGDWRRMVEGGYNLHFSSNGLQAIYQTGGDSLCIWNLGEDIGECIAGVRSYLLSGDRTREWLAYQETDSSSSLVLRELGGDRKSIRFSGVIRYQYNTNGNALLMDVVDSLVEGGQLLQWLEVGTESPKVIWRGSKASHYGFNGLGNALTFLADAPLGNGHSGRSIWYYDALKGGKAFELVRPDSVGLDSLYEIVREMPVFSRDGDRLFFHRMDRSQPSAHPGSAQVDVWNYRDGDLQSSQLLGSGPMIFEYVVNIANKRVIRLQGEAEAIRANANRWNDDYKLLYRGQFDGLEWWWNTKACPELYVVSTRDGSRKLVAEHAAMASFSFAFSPKGHWLIYYDLYSRSYISYDLQKGVGRMIKKSDAIEWGQEERGSSGTPTPGLIGPLLFPAGIAGWVSNDQGVLLYDQYDIWKLDPTGKAAPVNLTGGYGRRHHIRFRLVGEEDDTHVLAEGEELFLTAFDEDSKYSGFYLQRQWGKGAPEMIGMEPWGEWAPAVKAKDAEKWLVSRMSATKYPNYWVTGDLRHYRPISNLQPQQAFHWLTADLVHWKGLDGKKLSGILYRPEDFNPNKKYPVLFTYYEKSSDELYDFQAPEVTQNSINIPYFVSRGYVVMVPDIEYKIGYPGESVVNGVVSAARFLSKEKWVDSTRMGINGHSFGGYETNYLITHSHLFAAAAEGSGAADCISEYGSLMYGYGGGSGSSLQCRYEVNQMRIGASLWQRPDLYIKNSPLLKADQVTTPLLMMHNKADVSVPFEQGVEFFTSLRRLGKRVWLLQYDGGAHIVGGDAMDYTIRLTQFFDHYLKSSPPPLWMTEGIPARLKGIETGYGLDTSGRKP